MDINDILPSYAAKLLGEEIKRAEPNKLPFILYYVLYCLEQRVGPLPHDALMREVYEWTKAPVIPLHDGDNS